MGKLKIYNRFDIPHMFHKQQSVVFLNHGFV